MADVNPLKIISEETVRIESVVSGRLELMDVGVSHSPGPEYEGPYEFTPSAEEQVIPVARLVPQHDIVVHAIPQNYGRIEWNGNTLRVI